jgi:hypothetical protein
MAKKVSKQVAEVLVDNSAKKIHGKVAAVVSKKVKGEDKNILTGALAKATGTFTSWFKKGNTVAEKVEEVKDLAAPVSTRAEKIISNLRNKRNTNK